MADASAQDLERLLDENDLVVVDFYATWCHPCKGYSPKFERVGREIRRMYPKKRVAFVKIDIDLQKDLAKDARVSSVPTTVAFSRGRSFFGRPVRKEQIRFAGDRPWPDLVRTMAEIVETYARRAS
jgi:thioredoxin 1